MNYLSNLNDMQKRAVLNTKGPLLILAGAGSGKTRVLTTRIAHIINTGLASSGQILALTFTNKAANEMKERIMSYSNEEVLSLWVGTFHAICLRILKRHPDLVGLQNNFIILDTDDVLKIINDIIKDMGINDPRITNKYVAYKIERWKDKALTPEKVEASFDEKIILQIYTEYQKRLREINSVDFGDLILHCITIFAKEKEILSYWQEKFKYVLVDEYQDTNAAQYILLRLFAINHQNIACVGDDDQSIYSWRGAEVGNILRFEKDFQGAEVIRLEQNYRSTESILKTASFLIANNNDRLGKTLWSENGLGEKVQVVQFDDGIEEANSVVSKIIGLVQNGAKYSDNVILVRAAYQTQSFENALRRAGVPYKMVGLLKFYERMEIKDAVAYLRLCFQNNDNMALIRIINAPKRGIGGTTVEKIRIFAMENGISMFVAIQKMLELAIFKGKTYDALSDFYNKVQEWSAKINNKTPKEFAEMVLEESGYLDIWRLEETEEAKSRIDNIGTLFSDLGVFETIGDFLEEISLVNSKDDGELNEDGVLLMTMHTSKGLEFDNVFLPVWEEGSFPNNRAVEEKGKKGLEEERRLAYVAITRAKKNLFISYTHGRKIFGSYKPCQPSIFIKELPEEFIEHIKITNKEYTDVDEIIRSANSDYGFKEAQEFLKERSRKGLVAGGVVKHSEFGKGVIKRIDGEIATVLFGGLGEKRIICKFLEKY